MGATELDNAKSKMNDILDKISKAVIEGDVDSIGMLTKLALSKGLTSKDILDEGLMPGMDHVGVEFHKPWIRTGWPTSTRWPVSCRVARRSSPRLPSSSSTSSPPHR